MGGFVFGVMLGALFLYLGYPALGWFLVGAGVGFVLGCTAAYLPRED